MRWLVLLVLPVLLFRPLDALSEEEGTTRVPLPHPVPDETYWYGVYQDRTKVGWARLGLELVGEGAEAIYVSRTSVKADLTGMGQRVRLEFFARDEFRGTAPFDLLRSREWRKENDRLKFTAVDRRYDGYDVRVREGGEMDSWRLDDFDYTLSDRLSHIHWVQGGIRTGDRLRVREFDVSELQSEVYQYDVQAMDQVPAHGIQITTWEVPMRSDRKGPLGTILMDSEGRVIQGPLAGVAEMRAEPSRQALSRSRASDLLAFGHAPATEPLGDPRLVKRLIVAVYGRDRELFEDGPRLRVHPEPESQDVLLVAGEGVGASDTASAKDVTRALEAQPEDTEFAGELMELLERATEDALSERDQVESLVAFVKQHIADVHQPDPLPLSAILAEPKGAAAEHVTLFLALARRAGLAARRVEGMVYLGDELQAFGGHTWCEVALDGRWMPVDPTWGQTTTDGTHVAFRRGAGRRCDVLAKADHLTFEIRNVDR